VGAGPPRLVPLLVLAAAAGCATPRPSWQPPERPSRVVQPPESPKGDDGGERIHVVEPGENLYRIGLRYGLDPDEIADLNEISDPRSLAVGRELRLPKRAGEKPAAAGARAQARTASTTRRAPPAGEPILAWPVQGVLYSRFGARGAGRHDGIDIAAPEGSPIGAAADGEVIYSGTQRGYGNIVIVRHEDGLITIYAHNRQNLVKQGAKVTRGQPLAKVGRTGRATGPHCHFEVRRGTTPLDPLDFLPR